MQEVLHPFLKWSPMEKSALNLEGVTTEMNKILFEIVVLYEYINARAGREQSISMSVPSR